MTAMKPAPPRWGEDKLTAFFDLARENSFASYARLRGHWAKLLEIDSAFLLITENLVNPPDHAAPFFLLKAHSAFRAAASLAMAGQSPEAFMVMRGCVENALYGLYVNRNDGAFEIYLNRHDDDASRARAKSTFTIANMWKCLRGIDDKLLGESQQIYERTIDFGAHPNVAGLLTALKMSKTEDETRFNVMYITSDHEMIKGTMKSAAIAGVTAIGIFRHVFKERYDLLGLTHKLPSLREGL